MLCYSQVNCLMHHSEFENVTSTAMDIRGFIQDFGRIILHSTPQLYASALPFLPATQKLCA